MKKLMTIAAAIAAVTLISCSKPENSTPTDGGDTPTYVPPTPALGYGVYPFGAGIYTDTEIRLEFDAAPQLGTSGTIKIQTASGSQVDCIYMEDVAAQRAKMENSSVCSTVMDALSANPGSTKYYRYVWYEPVRIEGNAIIIKPHSGVLDFGSEYNIVIDSEAIVADGFSGVKAGEWAFLTKDAPESKTEITVGKNGNTDFRTVQAALNYACKAGQSVPVVISINNGTYEEQIYMRNKNNVTLKGQSRSGVILRYSNCESLASGVGSGTDTQPRRGSGISRSGGRAVMLLENCDNIRFENMSLCNSWDGARSQAEMLYFNSNDGTGRLVFVNCNISSRQDTINTKGYGWFYNCQIEGNVDYIWGSPETVLFENCEIRTVSDSQYSTAWIVQCRCLKSDAVGFVFLNCRLTSESGVPDGTIYLARSSGSSSYYDNVSYINCEMTAGIASAGWYSNPAPNPTKASATMGWKEYGSTLFSGSAVNVSGRYSGSIQLTQSQYGAGYADRATIFSGCSKGTDWLVETI